jgi:hypothetical protein
MSESPRFGGSEYFVARFLREYFREIGSHRGCENSENEVYPVSACRPENEVYPVFRALGCKPASPQFGALIIASYSVKNKVSRRIVWPIIEPKACKNAQQQAKKKNIRPAFGAKNEVYPGAIEEKVRNGSQYEVYPVPANRSPPRILEARLRPANYSSGSAPIRSGKTRFIRV